MGTALFKAAYLYVQGSRRLDKALVGCDQYKISSRRNCKMKGVERPERSVEKADPFPGDPPVVGFHGGDRKEVAVYMG